MEGRVLMVLEEPQIPAEDTVVSRESRRLRICELALVLGVGYLVSTVVSLWHWWTGRQAPWTEISDLCRILYDVLAMSVLMYILHRQGRSLKSIGLTARVSDFFWAMPVLFCTYLVSHAVYSVVPATSSASFSGNPVLQNVGWLTWLSIVPSAAAEELIVRAYLMTEVAELTGRMGIAVLASVGFQTLYHLYQGTSGALVSAGWFFVAAAFYASTRRVTPLIIAHSVYNFWGFS
jgi:membrane protease YdiL (CAAX protease family)